MNNIDKEQYIEVLLALGGFGNLNRDTEKDNTNRTEEQNTQSDK